MSIQAWVLGITLSILTVLMVLLNFRSLSSGFAIRLFVLWLLWAGVTVYDTECLVSGNCIVWSWIRTVLYMILPVLLIIAALLSGGGA